MPVVAMFVDGEQVSSKGMMAPKKNRSISDWTKDVVKLFDKELEAHGCSGINHHMTSKRTLDENHIRFGYVVGQKQIGFMVDRGANWTMKG
jgi:hypothetical protein